jgi:hypothetical protein
LAEKISPTEPFKPSVETPATAVAAPEEAPPAEIQTRSSDAVTVPASDVAAVATSAPSAIEEALAASETEAAPTEAAPAEAAPASEVAARPDADSPARTEAAPIETSDAADAAPAPRAAATVSEDNAPTLRVAPKVTLPPPPILPPRAPMPHTPTHYASSGSEMPVVIATPAPRLRPGVLARARFAAERAWTAQSAWISAARRALPRAGAVSRRAAALLPRAKTLGSRAASELGPRARRLIRPVRRAVPHAAAWARRSARSAPRSAVITAPFVLLFLVWLGHGVATRHRPNPQATRHVAPSARTSAPAAQAATPATQPAEPKAIAASVIAPSMPSATPIANDDELNAAVSQGLPAMEALAVKYAADPQVLIALAGAEAQAQRYDAAISSIVHALDAAPQSAQNGKIMGILWRAAQSPASEDAFACMRQLGARGSDVEFDLATTAGVREAVRERAKSELSNHLAIDASADTRAAVALLLAPDCTARKALLDRAERDGGKRTLGMLGRISRGVDCTSASESSCNACLNGSSALGEALSKLTATVKP